MARKRVKTLAEEWAVAAEQITAVAKRLRIDHVSGGSSLLTPDETLRVKKELEEERQRQSLLRRETVLETEGGGQTVEKRLTATVVRRRHREGEPPSFAANVPADSGSGGSAAWPQAGAGETELFVVPTVESPRPSEVDLFLEEFAQPGREGPQLEPLGPPRASEELAGERGGEAAGGAASALGQARAPSPASPVEPASVGRSEAAATGAASGPRRDHPVGQPTGSVRASAASGAAPGGNAEPAQPRAAARSGGPAGEATGPMGRPEPPATASGAPGAEEAQRGPKVLGRIDLRKVGFRPAAAPGRTTPAARPGFGQAGPAFTETTGSQAAPNGLNAPAATPVGARPARKRRVVRKSGSDFTLEREPRGLRMPRKKRALPGKEQKKTEITTPKASKRVIKVGEAVTVADLAHAMGVKASEVIKKLMDLGVLSTVNQVLDVDSATLVAGEFGYSVENAAFDAEAALEETTQVEAGESVARPPVVTVMGHVDHGKTSLLDAIRRSNVAGGEAGGITQQIGAYVVSVGDRRITWIDTPGHEAFTAMRARGAKVTDIVVLVVAADEGLMPQTVEAINHARAAEVPIVVAINKIDRTGVNLERVKQQLSEQGLIPEEYGGQTITVPVSARTGEGITRLLEMILLQAEVMDLKANPARGARATVIESRLDRGRGPVATVLVQEGTLVPGAPFVCGTTYGRVRAMLDHDGQRVAEAGPSTPVEVFGFSAVPEPGTTLLAVAEEAKARQIAEFRRSKQREGGLQKTSRVSLDQLSERMKAGEAKELKVVVKADTQGAVEALALALSALGSGEVKLTLVHSSVGAVSETDVTLAAASGGLVVGFNVRPEPKAMALAEKQGVEVRLYSIIYDALNDLRAALEGLLEPSLREAILGRAEVRQLFTTHGLTVAGSMVVEGKVVRNARARLVRDSKQVWSGKLASLRRFKEDVREVQTGFECGIALENFNDIKPGDIIEAFELEEVERRPTGQRQEQDRPQTFAAR
jgi:translation initiation factor IF-2